jgi:hypothetical protein
MNEISDENLLEIEMRYRSAVVVGLGQIAMTVAVAVAAMFVVARTEAAETSESVIKLWVAILFVAVGSVVLRRSFFGWERLRNEALLRGVPGVIKKLQSSSLILGLFAAAIAVIGFVVTMFTGGAFDMIRATAIALIVFFITFPRKRVWKSVVGNLQGI